MDSFIHAHEIQLGIGYKNRLSYAKTFQEIDIMKRYSDLFKL